MRHAPQCEATVVPFESPDLGTRLALFAVLTTDSATIEPATLRAVCLRQLPPHLVPARIEILDRWPLNAAFKVDRSALAERALQSRPALTRELSVQHH
jgi:acyl-CoA synthetase (AMP-forming)/AMP-acid ligase II